MVAMQAKTIVITGASDGIGAAAARQLRRHRLILLGRSPEKTHAVADELGATAIVADFAHLGQVRDAARAIAGATDHIDVLANNAGLISSSPRVVTDDGHELTNQVNYLSPFLLTSLLMPQLLAGRATVIATSSMAHWVGDVDLDDPDHEASFSVFGAYGTSKLELLLMTRELQRRHGADGLNAVAFHPGMIGSSFALGTGSLIERFYATPLFRVVAPPSRGADSLVFLAEATPGVDFEPGSYVVNRRQAAVKSVSRSVRLADALWRKTEQTLGLA